MPAEGILNAFEGPDLGLRGVSSPQISKGRTGSRINRDCRGEAGLPSQENANYWRLSTSRKSVEFYEVLN